MALQCTSNYVSGLLRTDTPTRPTWEPIRMVGSSSSLETGSCRRSILSDKGKACCPIVEGAATFVM